MAIENINSHVPVKESEYFFDCMIWMYLCSPHGDNNKKIRKKYSRLQGAILTAGAKIYITDVLISEFINTYIREEFRIYSELRGLPTTKEYFKKTFKKTEEYKTIINDLKLVLEREIYPCTERKDIKFSSINVSDVFNNPETFDFNDKYYGLNFENEPTYIVTHDVDFANVPNCNIITASSTLLSATQATRTPSSVVTSTTEHSTPDIDEEITL